MPNPTTPTPAQHKPDCAVNEPSYGVNPCTCGTDKPAPPVMGYGGPLEDLTSPVAPVQPFTPITPPAPTADEVREAVARVNGFLTGDLDNLVRVKFPGPSGADLRTILAALAASLEREKKLVERLFELNSVK